MEVEHNRELLLATKNLRDLGDNPFPYIIPIVPRLLPVDVIKGEHFVLTYLFKLVQVALLGWFLLRRAKRRPLKGP